ncbi:unnamed protein product, partial [Lymnaea stagnalis]
RVEIQRIVLHCFVIMIHKIHSCSPDERQVEVPDVFSSYMQVMLGISSKVQEPEKLILVVDAIRDMVNSPDKLALQMLLL